MPKGDFIQVKRTFPLRERIKYFSVEAKTFLLFLEWEYTGELKYPLPTQKQLVISSGMQQSHISAAVNYLLDMFVLKRLRTRMHGPRKIYVNPYALWDDSEIAKVIQCKKIAHWEIITQRTDFELQSKREVLAKEQKVDESLCPQDDDADID